MRCRSSQLLSTASAATSAAPHHGRTFSVNANAPKPTCRSLRRVSLVVCATLRTITSLRPPLYPLCPCGSRSLHKGRKPERHKGHKGAEGLYNAAADDRSPSSSSERDRP